MFSCHGIINILNVRAYRFRLGYYNLITNNCVSILQVGLLNVDGYYNSLLSFIDKAVDEGFISPLARRIILSAPTAKQLVRQLEVKIWFLLLCNLSYCAKVIKRLIFLFFLSYQEYVPEYDEITSKLVWDEVDRLNYVPESEVAT